MRFIRMRGWTLACAHARSGYPIALSTYLGTGQDFDSAIADFSQRCADQIEQDYQAFSDTVRSGRCQRWPGFGLVARRWWSRWCRRGGPRSALGGQVPQDSEHPSVVLSGDWEV